MRQNPAIHTKRRSRVGLGFGFQIARRRPMIAPFCGLKREHAHLAGSLYLRSELNPYAEWSTG